MPKRNVTRFPLVRQFLLPQAITQAMKRIFLLTTMVFCSLQGNSAVGVIKHRNRARPGVRSPPLENVLTLQRVRNLAQAVSTRTRHAVCGIHTGASPVG
ncbi:hypothetical protein GN956_G11137 [Arapaima gigas]